MAANRVLRQTTEDENKPSFLKVLFDTDLSSDSLRMIPSEFLRSVSGNFSYRVTLKVASGDSWSVRLYKNKRGLFMEAHEWIEFLEDNCLGDGELLVFTHEGKMRLSVKIFRKDALEVLAAPEPIHRRSQKTEAPRSAGWNMSGIGTNRRNIFKDVKEEESEFEMGGWVEFLGQGGRKCKWGTVLPSKKAPEPNISRKTKAHRVHEAPESSSSSRFPQFTVKIKKSYLQFVAVPKAFAVRHLPGETTKLVIRDLRGNSWEVVYICRETHRTFSGGWSQVARANRLKFGDVCMFELLSPTEIRLHVSRMK